MRPNLARWTRLALLAMLAAAMTAGCNSDEQAESNKPTDSNGSNPADANATDAPAGEPANSYHINWSTGPGHAAVFINGFPEIFSVEGGHGTRPIYLFVRDGVNEVEARMSRLDSSLGMPQVTIIEQPPGKTVEQGYKLLHLEAGPEPATKRGQFTAKVPARRIWEDAEEYGRLTDAEAKAIRKLCDEIFDALKRPDFAALTTLRWAAVRDKSAMSGRPLDDCRREWQSKLAEFYARGHGEWQRRTGGDLLLTELKRCVVVHDVVTDSPDRWVFRRAMKSDPEKNIVSGWIENRELIFIRLAGKWHWLR